MNFENFWRGLSPKQLNIFIQVISLVAIFFEGYDQGVMGGVNNSPDYVRQVGIGLDDGTVLDQVHQGGIVSIYYLGAIFGCFGCGYVADLYGRVNGTLLGSLIALVGGALQAGTVNSDMILVSRLVTGFGVGGLTAIVPVMCSEFSSTSHRGGFLGYVFIANYLGISVAYWLDFGLAFIDGGYSAFRWRFQLAFQCVPAIILACFVKFLPDSPRYLASVGRNEEAFDVLKNIRGVDENDEDLKKEYAEIVHSSINSTPASPVQFAKILLGRVESSKGSLAHRAWLCVFLQIMASWSGITAVTAYSPVLLRQAGYSEIKQNGLAGGLNTVGIIGTIISAQIVDQGRRKWLMFGSLGLCIVNAIAGGLYEGSRANPELSEQIAPAAVAMLFLFNIFYASTWGTIAFLIPTELYPAELRAQGNSFGITGWAIGVGMTTLVNPIMFDSIENRTYFLFAALNLLWIPTVYFFYPETANRSLESIYVLFASESVFNHKMEKHYQDHGDILAEHQITADEVVKSHKSEKEKV